MATTEKGSLVHPAYIAGRFYAAIPFAFNAAAAMAAIDTIYFLPFAIHSKITLVSAAVRVGTGGAGSSIKAGIWANSVVSNRPLGAPPIVDNTGVATTASGAEAVLALAGDLTAGFYWYGIKTTGTIASITCALNTNDWMQGFMGVSTAANNPLGCSSISIADTYSNNMPTLAEGASFGFASSSVPHLMLRT